LFNHYFIRAGGYKNTKIIRKLKDLTVIVLLSNICKN